MPEVYSFGKVGLAASCSYSKTVLGKVIVLALKNSQIPYIFVDCKSIEDYEKVCKLTDNYCNNWE